MSKRSTVVLRILAIAALALCMLSGPASASKSTLGSTGFTGRHTAARGAVAVPTPEVPVGVGIICAPVIANQRNGSFTVAWGTDGITTGKVLYGTSSDALVQTACDVRDSDPACPLTSSTHFVTLTGLATDAHYFVQVVTGGVGGAVIDVATGPALDRPAAPNATNAGLLYQADGIHFGTDSIVCVTVQDANGQGSPGTSAPECDLIPFDHQGFWSVDLAHARTADLQSFFSYSNTGGDQIVEHACGGAEGCAGQTVDSGSGFISPVMTLGPNCLACDASSCDDHNPCTDDSCNADTQACTSTPNDNNSCDDGNACTIDACIAGVCQAAGGPPEVCDGVDNDCDGSVDEDLGAITCGIGACERSVDACVGGAPGTCTPGEPGREVCDGIDNNCDGVIDEGLGSTTCGEGACKVTVANCIDGVPQECTGQTPSPEACDGLDNDCDGSVDEELGTTTCGVGACEATVASCAGGVPQTCVPADPAPEVCDGLDNDCDGSVDEDMGSTPTTCGVGACAATGTASCVDGHLVDTCLPGTAGDEVCDGVDNDCDGSTDEDLGGPISCGVGACTRGVPACVDGAPGQCVPGEPSEEVCDGADNDCDGSVDEDIPSTPTTCGVGACAATGTSSCVDGRLTDSCVAGTPSPEVCDGVDNDCDGTVDGDSCGGTLEQCLACPADERGKVTICHKPDADGGGHTLEISRSALQAHCRKHGDTCGPCGGGDDGPPVSSNHGRRQGPRGGSVSLGQ